MKKILLLGLTSIFSLGMLQVQAASPFEPEDVVIEVKRDNGTTNNSYKWCNTWTSTASEPRLTIRTTNKNNALTAAMQWHGIDGITGEEAQYVHLYSQDENLQPVSFTMSVSGNPDFYISGYTLKAKYYETDAEGETTITTANGEAYTFNGSSEEQTITVNKLPKGTNTTFFLIEGKSKPIKVWDFYVTLTPSTRDTNAAGMPYFARELDNLNLKFYVNYNNRYLHLNDSHDGLGKGDNTQEKASIWHTEFVEKTADNGTDLSGLRISSGGVYLGKMPDAKSALVNVTTDPDEAGLWRFFAHNGGYGLSCSEYQNGTPVILEDFGGADAVNKNAWIQIGDAGVQRWGVFPDAAHWNAIVVNISRDDLIRAISNETQFVTIKNILSKSSLFNAETASSEILKRLSIPEDITAEDFDTELKKAKTELETLSASKIVTEYLNGKKVMFSCGKYIKKGLSNGDNVRTIDTAWKFFADENYESFTMCNAVDDMYAQGLTVTENKEDATHYVLTNETVINNGQFAIKDPDVTNGDNFLNNNSGTSSLRYWAAGSGNGSSFWTINLVTPEDEQKWIDDAIAMLNVSEERFGDEPGLLKEATERVKKLEELKSLNPETTAIDYSEIYDITIGISDYNATLFDMHGIESTALIRIKDINGHYMVNTGGFAEKTEPGEETIFVVENNEEGIAAVSSFNGHYLTTTVSGNDNEKAFLRIFPGEEENISNNTPTAINFLNKYPGFTNSYVIGFVNGVNKKSILASANDAFNHYTGTETDYNMALIANHICFNVEYVKTLNVAVEEGGYKLWRTPVTVSFYGNEDGCAYVVSVTGTTINTSLVDQSDTYPAGTVFILTKPVTLTVENGVKGEAKTAGLGHHAKQMHKLTAGKVYLSVASEEDTPVATQSDIALFSDTQNTVKMDVSVPAQDIEKLLEAHEVLIEATNSDKNPLSDGSTLELALGGNTTTNITEVTAEGRNADSVYDLQGRKLAAPVKGINIVNGQKLLVK